MVSHGDDTSSGSLTCKCLETGPRYPAAKTVRDLGDDPKPPFGEAMVHQCSQCGRVWVKYLLFDHERSRSGRWAMAPIDADAAASIQADEVLSYIEAQPWHLLGGSYFGDDGPVRRVGGKLLGFYRD